MKMKFRSIFLLPMLLLLPLQIFADWETLPNAPAGAIKDLLITGDRIYAISWTSGVNVSSDFGDNWVQYNNGITSQFVNCIAFSNNVMLVGTLDSGVFRSTNLGANWVHSSDSLPEKNVINIVGDGADFYLLTETSRLYKSIDGGKTWFLLNTSGFASSITAFDVKEGKILAGTIDANLYLSTDNGENWTDLKTAQLSSSINYVMWKGTDIYLGTDLGVYFSSNQGKTWFLRNEGMKGAKVTFLKFANNKLIAGTRSSGIYFSEDNGNLWFDANEGIPDMSILGLELDNYYLYAGTEYGSVTRRRLSEFVIPVVQAPVLSQPQDGAVGLDSVVGFSWEASKGAVGYHLVVATSADFSPQSIVFDKNNIKTNYWTVDLQFNWTYYWKVAAIDYKSEEKWSGVFRFSTKIKEIPVDLYYPFDDMEISNLPLTFYWSYVPTILKNTLEISESETFDQLVFSADTTDTTYTVSNTILNNKTYYWRVVSFYPYDSVRISKFRKFRTTVLSVDSTINDTMFDFRMVQQGENIQIFFRSEEYSSAILNITDIFGRNVFFGQMSINPSYNQIVLDVHSVPSGFYYYRFVIGNRVYSGPFLLVK
jgi:photosystem II stability/assembly factor-like uncharacterized protein